LAEEGVLEEHDVEIMGTPLDTIYATEDRDLFRQRMERIGQPVPRSTTISLSPGESVTDFDERAFRTRVEDAVDEVGGLPVIARTTYTLGGSGSGVVHGMDDLVERVRKGLRLSRNGEVLITESIAGWVELEYEVMRDAGDSCVIICNMENIDPMGIHTGESVVVTPSQVIPDEGHQEMRDAALEVIRELGIQGGCNIQFAWHDDGSPGGEYRVVEVNPRVSRSSALASKATGYPIARVTAKVALGKRLHEIENEITGETTAAFEPAIDYVVTKVPRWPKDKFDDVDFELGTAMKSTGEAMAIGRTFEESLLKALRSSEYDPAVDLNEVDDGTLEREYLETPTPDRPYAILEAFDRGYTVDEVATLTGIEEWYLERFERVADAAATARGGEYTPAAMSGHTNAEVAAIAGAGVEAVESDVPDRAFKQVDTCAGEFEASTPYYYSARLPEYLAGDGGAGGGVDRGRGSAGELQLDPDLESVVVVGGGPIRIGQGVEFDYCAVHAVNALEELGIDAHVVNNNPETVSTDYDTSDGLFFEPITAEEVADAVEETNADGVMVQFGGQTSVNIGEPLERELERRGLDCSILGTSVDAMDLAEDRDRFNRLMEEHGIAQPVGGSATSEAEALDLANEIGYPVLVRPSYVLGGRAMDVVSNDEDLKHYIEEAVRVSPDRPILVDDFLADAVELDVDAVSDGEDVLIGGIMEHVETAGVHSGDSACMIPPRSLSESTLERVREVTLEIAQELDTVGLLNVQLAVRDGEVYVLEANPRSSRTVPFVSKATGVPISKLAAKVMAGATLEDLHVHEQIPEQVSVKEVVLPFDRLPGSDPRLGPEMKSTGEVMGTARSFGKAYLKSQDAVGKPIPREGTAVVDLETLRGLSESDEDLSEIVETAQRHFDVRAPEEFEDLFRAVRSGEVDFILSRDRDLLEVAVDDVVTYFSTVPSARAALEAIETKDEPLDVAALSERPTERRRWGVPDVEAESGEASE
ncbi:MAG: carbamoyl-phosphate synthase large subunit, partial [Haloarculaceae archaeon]